MSLYINKTPLKSCYYNGEEVSSIYVNNTLVWPVAGWDWGDETAVGDADWWAELKEDMKGRTTEEKEILYLGKTKRISLSTNVVGCSHFLMRCIGCDQDGTDTLAFNAVYGSYNTTAFGTPKWISPNGSSTIRSYCQQIYDYCSAKASIKIVSKGTCEMTNNSRAGTVTYNDETVFLLSEREYGLDTYSPISTANSTTSKAECTYGYNAPYSYYSSGGNSSRIMYRMSSATAISPTTTLAYPWERSRNYSVADSTFCCCVRGNGTAYRGMASGARALAPAFVIG